MASEIMSKITKAEEECEQKIAQTRQQALNAIDDAQKKAAEYKKAGIAAAEKRAEEILADANAAARKILDDAEKQSAEDTAVMRKAASARSASAITAVAKKLAQLD